MTDEHATEAQEWAAAEGSLPLGRLDVSRIRERNRKKRLVWLFVFLLVPFSYLLYRQFTNPIQLPQISPQLLLVLPMLFMMMLFMGYALYLLMTTRSPHVLVRPEDIEVGLDEVRGLDTQVGEVQRTLDVFLGYASYREQLGGNPRRAVLLEGPPGTGKTYLAKATAKSASVPFLFISGPAFQTFWQGMSAMRIRSYFRTLRKLARRDGGAIGFIEEIDAIGSSRMGVASASPERLSSDGEPGGYGPVVSRFMGSGDSGLINELLIQMQSFDQPRFFRRIRNRFVEWMNGFLPREKRMKVGKPEYHNILVFAATNRADMLDAALLRPGRFDQRLYFDPPTRRSRRDLIDFFLDRRSHHEQLDRDEIRDQLARDTLGYTPVMIEHLTDEALLVGIKNGRRSMNVEDIYEAKLNEEIGLKQPVVYTDGEREAIATHEAGHATVAHFLGKDRKLEVLSIIKRRSSLGVLTHGDTEERFTRTRSEIEALIAIALGGMVAEEEFLGESGTGPASDLAAATELATHMVGSLGMAGSLISYDAMVDGPLSSKNLTGKVLSDADGKARVEQILEAQRARAREVLTERRHVIEALRDALVERDELVGGEITDVIEAALAIGAAEGAEAPDADQVRLGPPEPS